MKLFKKSSSQAVVHDGSRELDHGEIMVIITALMLAMFLAALDQTIVSTALPKIARELNGLSEYSWVATSYLLTSAIATPIYGKISDMFGRKKIFMASITLFLVGSALCGLSQNMGQLILFRGIQGLGGGGIFSLALAIVGDIVPPSKRGRYQGYFGAVFGVSSVAGPLLGGLITDHLSWRWIFYINLPIGILALAAISARLHLPVRKTDHQVDYAGALLLAATAGSLLLTLVWGGTKYAWGSHTIVGLMIGFVVALAAFLARETKAAEPIIPLRLFKNGIFRVSTILSLLSGMVMFGAILFLPQYQQLVRGESATASGLLMTPLVFGLLAASITSGRLISKLGRYRMFPIVGTLGVILGFFLFSHISMTTSHFILSLWMIVLGLGIGSFMQVMTLATQNAVKREDLGSATSVVVFARTIGSSLGAAIFGAILTARLNYHLKGIDASGVQVNANNLSSSIGQAGKSHPEVVHTILQAFSLSFRDVFLYAIPFAIAAFIASLFLKDAKLRGGKDEAHTMSPAVE
ncbi:MAG: transporter [Candidatus Saccharibacteria bacterium]|nr:transporter [Candidatus Saccharibacteria bacterium]